MRPALVAVAHGSRDPRSAATISALVDRVRWLRPDLDVRLAFLDLCAPRLDAVLATVSRAGEFGVVLAAAGSQQPPANATIATVATAWARRTRWQVIPAFACAARPAVPDALAILDASGARRIAVASWFLAPGLLADKVTRQVRESRPDAVLATPLGAHDAVAALIVDRYERATGPHIETVVPCCKRPHRGSRSGRTAWAQYEALIQRSTLPV